MTTISAKELRDNLSDYLQRSAAGEEIEVLYRSRRLVRILPVQSADFRYSGTKVGKRLDKLLPKLAKNKGKSDESKSTKELYHEMLDERYGR